MADRDDAIDAKANQLHATKCAGWNVAAAKDFVAQLGRSEQDEGYKDARGVYPSQNGWPVTTLRGARISLQEVVDIGGKAAFLPARI